MYLLGESGTDIRTQISEQKKKKLNQEGKLAITDAHNTRCTKEHNSSTAISYNSPWIRLLLKSVVKVLRKGVPWWFRG